MTPFAYGKGKQRVVMSYWRMPDRLFDDPDELAAWAKAAFGAAQRASGMNARRKSGVRKKRK